MILNMNFHKTTEQESNYKNLEHMDTIDLLKGINNEDHKVANAVQKEIPAIQKLVNAVLHKMKDGGRLFYIGAGTSGRLGILDASECPPTFGVNAGRVIGLIAGGDDAIRKAVEHAEDDQNQAIKDLYQHKISDNDSVIGIAASGTTPYVIGGINACNKLGIITGAITCNQNSPLALSALFPIVPIVGPEFITGSSRMKAGTAQKMVLNMISTTIMIQLGHIKGNRMVDMQLSNDKLVDRGTRMIMDATEISYQNAKKLLLEYGVWVPSNWSL
ncbi:MAG: N-acetylmuramic acid 6-phosphate etherase, partial [Bacteroidota bacterium]